MINSQTDQTNQSAGSHSTLIASMLSRSVMFSGLDQDSLMSLSEAFIPCTISQGQYLFRQGDMGNFLALLTHGMLGVKISSDPSRQYDATLEPFEIIGEMTCLDPAPRSASIVALTNAEVLILDRASVDRLRKNAPEAYKILLKSIWMRVATRLRVTNEAISMYTPPTGEATFKRREEQQRPITFKGLLALGESDTLKLFTEKEIDLMCSIARKRFYPNGSIICREGDIAKTAYIIAKGEMSVYRDLGRQRYELGRLGQGELFGQLALLEHRRRSATIEAQGDAVIIELNSQDFDRLIQSNTPFALRFQEYVTIASIRQLRAADQRYVG